MPHKDKEKRKQYHRDYSHGWYLRNRESRKEQIRLRRVQLREWYQELKKTFKCQRCSEEDSVCLEFHHPDPKLKEYSIADMVNRGFSKAKILEVIGTCRCLCANCHRKVHSGVV